MNQSHTLDGISIVITYFNEQIESQRCLSALVDSWKSLEFDKQRCIEITIIDDASSLPPRNLPTQPRINIVSQARNQGVGIARNLGAKLSTYSYVHFLDSDVLVDPTFLERLFNLLETHPQALIVQGHYSKEPANQPASLFNWYMALSWYHNSVINVDALSHATFINSGCVTFQREYFRHFGGYPAEYIGSGGEEFGILQKIGDGVILQDQTLINYHIFDSIPVRLRKLWRRGKNYLVTVVKNDKISVKCKTRYSYRVFSALLMPFGLPLLLISPVLGGSVVIISITLYALGSGGLFFFMVKEKGMLFGLIGSLFQSIEFFVASWAMLVGLSSTVLRRSLLPISVIKKYFV